MGLQMVGEVLPLARKEGECRSFSLLGENTYEHGHAITTRRGEGTRNGNERFSARLLLNEDGGLVRDTLGGAPCAPTISLFLHDSSMMKVISSSPGAASSLAAISVPNSPSVRISFTSARACCRFAIVPRATSSPART